MSTATAEATARQDLAARTSSVRDLLEGTAYPTPQIFSQCSIHKERKNPDTKLRISFHQSHRVGVPATHRLLPSQQKPEAGGSLPRASLGEQEGSSGHVRRQPRRPPSSKWKGGSCPPAKRPRPQRQGNKNDLTQNHTRSHGHAPPLLTAC